MIPITKPFFDEREEQAVREVLRSGWVVQGPKVREFEARISEFTRSQFALATTSCTTALHLSVLALGVGPGDEVIVPAFTFVASANAVEYVGARPMFVDIDLETFNIDVEAMKAALSPRTRAIMPVHLFGLCADMEAIIPVARHHRVAVIEDAACAVGAFCQGKHAGTWGEVGCLSFHPRKSITTGEGGMVLTEEDSVAKEVARLRDHGATMSDHARHERRIPLLPEYPVVGYNYRMTDVQGAIGVEQVKKLSEILRSKRRLAARYDAYLRRLPWLRPQVIPKGYEHGYQAYVCLFAPQEPNLENLARLHHQRNELMAALGERGVATRQGTHAVVLQSYYAEKFNLHPQEFPNAAMADQLSVALPLFPQMTDEEQDFVVHSLQGAFDAQVVA